VYVYMYGFWAGERKNKGDVCWRRWGFWSQRWMKQRRWRAVVLNANWKPRDGGYLRGMETKNKDACPGRVKGNVKHTHAMLVAVEYGNRNM
jgi:hypothetical protein